MATVEGGRSEGDRLFLHALASLRPDEGEPTGEDPPRI